MQTRTWNYKPVDEDAVRSLSAEGGFNPLLARILVLRGLSDAAEAKRFLDPRLADLADPMGLRGMAEAVDRILRGVDAEETICVWGDYDVDGVTSTALLASFFRELGIPLRTFIPDRFRDGYGLSEPPMRELAASGVKLVITVDCGITSHRVIDMAASLGVDVVVVDHHEPSSTLPAAAAIVNPLQPQCAFSFKKMAACGLVFHLLVALRAQLRARGFFGAARPEPDLRHYLDLAAIGTVADVVPLVGTNRVLTATGLRAIAQTRRPGVRALAHVSRTPLGQVRASTIGFQMGPRINAAGRLSHAGKGLELLLAELDERAMELALEVDEENQRRREIQDTMIEQAFAQVDAGGSVDERRGLVLASNEWHAGVSGIVASKVAERYHRPTIVIAVDDGIGKGSARSIPGFHLVSGLEECANWLDNYGGHAHAAGLTLRAEHVEAFARGFDDVARSRMTDGDLVPTLSIDADVALDAVTDELVWGLDRLAPFGMGNPRPLFAAQGVRVRECREVGKGHLSLVAEQAGATIRCIGFGLAERAPRVGSAVDLAFHAEHNTFRGQTQIQLRIRDIR